MTLLLAWMIACKTSDSDTEVATGPAYYGDVQPILNAQCSRCHTDGGVAPISFDDPDTVVLSAAAIRAATQEGRMPPPAPDPECAPYENAAAWTLAESDRDTLRAWADGGARLGDPALDAPKPGPVTSAPFDLELYGERPYTPSFGDGGDDYRCFRLDVGNASKVYMTGFEALVDQTAEVHHVVIFRDANGTVDPSPDGFSCGGFGDSDWEFLGGWAPGAGPLLLPEGAGLALQPDTTLVLQMHYSGSGVGTPDRSGFGLHTAPSVDREVLSVPFGATEFVIPAGELHEETDRTRWPVGYGRWQVLAVWPHMHQIGDGMDVRIERKDGSESCLVALDGWDFHNQLVAKLETPAAFGPGDTMSVTCAWDNREVGVNPKQFSDPARDVVWGEGSYDEMCFAFTYLMAD